MGFRVALASLRASQARQQAPVVLFLDELDALGQLHPAAHGLLLKRLGLQALSQLRVEANSKEPESGGIAGS